MSVEGNAGGEDQSPASLKSTLLPENLAWLKSTGGAPENLAPEKLTVLPENWADMKLTVLLPENSAPKKEAMLRKNRTLVNSTKPPENRAPPKSAPSKTTPVKSRSNPCQGAGSSLLFWRWAVMTRMTVWRTSRAAWNASLCGSKASPPGSGS